MIFKTSTVLYFLFVNSLRAYSLSWATTVEPPPMAIDDWSALPLFRQDKEVHKEKTLAHGVMCSQTSSCYIQIYSCLRLALSTLKDLCGRTVEMKWSTINLTAIEVGGGAHLHPQGISNYLSGFCCITSSTRCLVRSCTSRIDGQKVEGSTQNVTNTIYTVPVKMPPHVAGQWRWSISNLSY